MPKLSLIMAYHNRKDQFLYTLETIKKSEVKDIELVIVDDCSSEEHRLEDVAEKYPWIKLIRIDPEEKWWINCCIPFNIAFKNSTADIVIIQDSECCHVGDICKHALENCKEGYYVVYPCYSLSKENTEKLLIGEVELEDIHPIPNKPSRDDGDEGWYTHRQLLHIKDPLNFCAAIHRNDFIAVGGFSEEYASGIAYDDTDFTIKILANGNIYLDIVNEPFVFHLYHYHTSDFTRMFNRPILEWMNRKIYINKHRSLVIAGKVEMTCKEHLKKRMGYRDI